MNGDLLLPLPRVQRHRQPAVVETQRVPAGVKAGALGVVLTGMGRDGVEGASRLVACGGSVLAQDEASCAVWGMPRAVLEAGLACAVLPPDKIARRIASRTEDKACN